MKNPKQKLKNILLLLSVFFTFSCSKDAYEESSYEASKKYKVKSLQRSEIKNLEKKLKNFKAFTKFQYENNRTEISSIYDFSIETNDVKFIEAGNIKSYTFKVNRTVGNGLFENLQIIKKADGNYVAKLLQYNLTNEEQVLFLSGGYVDVNGKLTVINIDDPSFINNINAKLRGDCYDMIITSQENPCASGEHSYGQIGCIMPPSLQAKPDSNVYTIVSVNCDTGSGGDLENGVTTTPVSGGGGGSLWNQDSFYNNITLEQQTWLDNQTSTVNESILNYLITNGFSTTSRENVKNWVDVNILLNQNSNILLDVPCNQLPYWQTISQHEVPNIVKTKIQNIDNQTGWFESANIQNLGHPNNGATVNMDFFPVTISQMPKWPSGVAYTQKELFNHIRLNINDFFDNLTFTPVVNSSYGLNETALWNSTNPLGAILSINIVPDEGSVVCSKFNETTGEWYFTTIEVPWDGTHPVSGHRAFGYYTDVNGKMVIYTRGVDRYSFGTHMLGNTGATLEAASQLAAFSSADAKWQNFQQKIANFVNQGQGNGLNGASNVNVPEKYRPDWNKVKNVLNGTQPISTLGCN